MSERTNSPQNNADEGPGFVPQTITTESSFNTYISNLFPLMSNTTLSSLKTLYSIPPTTPGPLFSTTGTTTSPTALNQSEFAIGQQQRANNLYAETTFVCPSYWLASAYSPNITCNTGSDTKGKTRQGWKYQYSVPPAEHGADLDAYLAVNREALGYGTLSSAFRSAVQLIWGRFITHNDPTLPHSLVVNLTTFSNGTRTGDDIDAAEKGTWGVWLGNRGEEGGYEMLNLNMTGGVNQELVWTAAGGQRLNVTQDVGWGLEARVGVVDAWGWEGGRGARCAWWRLYGAEVPE